MNGDYRSTTNLFWLPYLYHYDIKMSSKINETILLNEHYLGHI